MWRIIQSAFKSNVVQENSIETPAPIIEVKPEPVVTVTLKPVTPVFEPPPPFTEMELTNFMNVFYVGLLQYERERFERRRWELHPENPNAVKITGDGFGSFVWI